MIESKIRDFLVDELNWSGSSEQLTDDFPLLANGVLDSLGIFHIVSFIESEFGVEIRDEELVPQHFGTIRGIAELVGTKRSDTA